MRWPKRGSLSRPSRISRTRAGEVDFNELDLVLGPTFVITHDPGGLVNGVRAEIERSPRLLQKGPAWVAHAILDGWLMVCQCGPWPASRRASWRHPDA